MSTDRCCVVFTKPARAGKVKTRLIGRLSPREAADLHRALLTDLVERLSGRAFELRIAWATAPGETLPEGGAPGYAQVGADLGERLFHGLSEAGNDYPRVAAIGSDHPEIPVRRLDRAFGALDRHDVALGPARDGGFYLIACRADRLHPELFREIEWSSSRVLDQVLERASELGLGVELLEEGDDVDVPEDLERLAQFLSATDHDCPSTEGLLRGWGMLT